MNTLPMLEPTAPGDFPVFYLPTNRWNLLAFLTAGLVTPRQGLTKYYADLLDDCPGRLPLISGPCPDGLTELLSREDPLTAFPVLIEFDSAIQIPAHTPVGAGVTAPELVVDVVHIAAVHFRNDAELEEHRLRGGDFANMPGDEIPLRVSPQMFGGGSTSIEELTGWLRALPRPRLADADFRGADRQAGALVAALDVAPGDPSLLSTIVGLVRTPPGHASSATWLSAWWMGRQRGRAGSASDRVLRSACDAVWSSDVSSWRSSDALTRVRSGLRLTGDDRRTYEVAFERLREVLANQRDLDPLSPRPGREVLQALVLFLLRPDPSRIAKWEGHGGSPAVLCTAMYLAGLLFGRRSLPSELRPLLLDRMARRLEIAWLLGLPVPEIAVETSTPHVVRVVGADGAIVLERERSLARLSELLEKGLPSDANVLALAVCREQGWEDLVEATAEVAGSGLRLESLPARRLKITVSGTPFWSFSVNAVGFGKRLLEVDPQAETEAMRELRASLTS